MIATTEAASFTLQDLKNAAKRKNNTLNALKFEHKQSQLQEKAVKAKFYPRLGFQGGLEKIETSIIDETETTKSFYGEVNLFNGFRDFKELGISKLESRSAKSRLKEEDFKLALKVEELFYRYLLLSQSDKVLEEEIDRNKLHLSLIKKRLSSSLVTESDLMEFELIRSRLESRHEFLELRMKEVKNELLGLAGIEESKVDLEGRLPHYILGESLSELLNSLPTSSTQIDRAQMMIEKSQLETEASYSGWMPRLDLKAEYGHLPEEETGFSHKTRSTKIGLFAKWELFSGLSTRNEQKLGQANRTKREYLLKQVKLDSKLRIQSAFSRIKALERRIDAEEKNLVMAEKLYKRVKREFRRGVKDSGTLAGISDQFAELSRRVFELKKNYIDQKIVLESTLSRPVKFKIVKH